MANTPEGSSLCFSSLIMCKLEEKGHPVFIFLFPHFEEMKADSGVFHDDKTLILPQKSALLLPWCCLALGLPLDMEQRAAYSTATCWHHSTSLLLWQTSFTFRGCKQGADVFYLKLHKKIWVGFDIKCHLFLSLQLGPWGSSLTGRERLGKFFRF